MRKIVGVFMFLILMCQAGVVSADFFDPTKPQLLIQQIQTQKKKPEDLSPSRFQLSFIVIGPDRKSAIINGHTVHTGDHFRRYLVMAIRPQSVVLKYQGKQWILYMNQVIKKQLDST